MSKHTPGPWRLGKNSDDVVANTPAGHSEEPDHVAYYGGHLVAESICSRNRALIAAAPELLMCLEEIVANHKLGHLYELAAKTVIAKAQGEP